MARSRGGDSESKQGLVVALVLFVLLSFVLAFLAYDGYAGKAQSDEKLRLAKIQENSLKVALERAELIAAIHRMANGSAAGKKEEQQLNDTLAGSKNKKDKRDANDLTHAQAFEQELKKLKEIQWDPTENAPQKTYIEQLTLLKKQADNDRAASKQAREDLEKANKDWQNRLAELTKAKEAADLALKQTKEDVEKRIKGVSDNYDKVVKEFEKNIISAEDFAKELNKLRKEKEDIEGKLQAALKDAELRIKKIEEKIPQIDLLAYDQPKGAITRLEGSSTVYINLGRLDLVRPGLTFSVFAVGAYKANAERKASVEVIEVIGDHLSKGRITEVRSAARDPVLTGDQLYNPAWSPGLREHVAVAGLIDLTGDGRDGTQDFVRMLEKQGVAVDAYLDTRDIAVKGKGINRSTGYLIIGEIPEFQAAEQIKEGDVRQERKININTAIAKMRDDAVRLGVTVVPARRFMALMGFQLPRTPATADDWNAYTFRPGAVREAHGNGKDMKGEMAGKEMKKEEMKKDEK